MERLKGDCKQLLELSSAGNLQTGNEHFMLLTSSTLSVLHLAKALGALALGSALPEMIELESLRLFKKVVPTGC